jgi:hypothetical protein
MTSRRKIIPRAGQTTLPPLPSLQQPLPGLSSDQLLLPTAGKQKPKQARTKQPRADPLAKHLWPKLKR